MCREVALPATFLSVKPLSSHVHFKLIFIFPVARYANILRIALYFPIKHFENYFYLSTFAFDFQYKT